MNFFVFEKMDSYDDDIKYPVKEIEIDAASDDEDAHVKHEDIAEHPFSAWWWHPTDNKPWYNPDLLLFFPDLEDPNVRDPSFRDLFYSELYCYFSLRGLTDADGTIPMGFYGYGQDFIYVKMKVFGEDRTLFTWDVCDELQELCDLFGYAMK